ncbi:MAG TPA: CHAT domain-containing tetratricopeptide repeat protein [Puia sp.]|uniref:CHAT domain-containing protein n=1 Tax=Puia sp. TaxID=2045100 RepID=UPI002C381C6F|nr:CHAT domain-containing tetratricopeptide repeat protein [Puia sp.]HVU95451.1 CHAT domain-containing tetratricopeptide repeat protein [Puia sp.]
MRYYIFLLLIALKLQGMAQLPDYIVYTVTGNATMGRPGQKPGKIKQNQYVFRNTTIVVEGAAEVTLVDKDANYIVLNKPMTYSHADLIHLGSRRMIDGMTKKYLDFLYRELLDPNEDLESFSKKNIASAWGGIHRDVECGNRIFPPNGYKSSSNLIPFKWHTTSPDSAYVLSIYNEMGDTIASLSVSDTMQTISADEALSGKAGKFFWRVKSRTGTCEDEKPIYFFVLDPVEERKWVTTLIADSATTTLGGKLQQIDILEKNLLIDAAFSYFDRLVRSDPDNMALRRSYVYLLLKYGFEQTARSVWYAAPKYGAPGSLLWRRYADSARSCNDRGDTAGSSAYFHKAMQQLKKDTLGSMADAKYCDTVAAMFYQQQQFEEAEYFYSEATQIKEKVLGKSHQEYRYSYTNLASFYMNVGQFPKAEHILSDIRQTQGKVFGLHSMEYGMACNNLASFYQWNGQFPQSEQLYLEAIRALYKSAGPEDSLYAATLNHIGDLYLDMGQNDKAENALVQARRIWGKTIGRDNAQYALMSTLLGEVYLNLGQLEQAKSLLVEGKDILEKSAGKRNGYYVSSCNTLARYYEEAAQYESAEKLLLEAKQIREAISGKLHPDYGTACMNLALHYIDMGQNDKAEALLLETKEIREKQGKENPDYAIICENLAAFYSDIGQHQKAEAIGREAKDILEKVVGKEHPEYAHTCLNLGEIYKYLGQYDTAEQLMMEARQIIEKDFGNEHAEYAAACRNLGNLDLERDKYDEAEVLLLEAKHIYAKAYGTRHRGYGDCCFDLARLHWAKREPLRADSAFKESFLVNSGLISSAILFSNEKEKSAFIASRFRDNNIAYSFYTSSKLPSGQPYALSLFQRNIILRSSEAMKKELYSVHDTAVLNKYNRWIGLRRRLAAIYSKPMAERQEDAGQLEEKAGQLEKELVGIWAGFKKQQQPVDWKAIQRSLKPDEASIEFVSFQLSDFRRYTDTVAYVAIVQRRDVPLPVMVYLFNERQLMDQFTSNVEGAGNQALYQLIWKPLEKELAGINTIYFAPAGLLHKVSFAAIPLGGKTVLSDRYRLVQLSSTGSVTELAPAVLGSSDRLQVYGWIDYHAGAVELQEASRAYPRDADDPAVSAPAHHHIRGDALDSLPGTKAELDYICKLAQARGIPVTALFGVQATEESVKALDGKASPSILHIGTHGFFFPDPRSGGLDSFQRKFITIGKAFQESDNPLLRSGLLFAGAVNAWQGKPVSGIEDGILTAYEISNMYLPNTRLVVLSACETALGDIEGSEGVYGLQRAFKMAGVQNLIMSLWKVPDDEAADFMHEFYKNLFAGKSVSDSFYKSQNTMKLRDRNTTYNWAAWVLVR